jgi:DNA-binding NtrC family response regulator
MDKPVERFTDEALASLSAYDWPGNVRELRNAVERSLLSCNGILIERYDLPDKVNSGSGESAGDESELTQVIESGLDNWLALAERDLIVEALKETDGVQVQAARLLGITERSLWHRIKKLDIRVARRVHD